MLHTSKTTELSVQKNALRKLLFPCFARGPIAVALFFTACSREETPAPSPDKEVVPTVEKATQPKAAPIAKSNTTPDQFMEAALNGDANIISRALMQGFDPNYAGEDGRTALMLAGFNGHIPTVRTLLKAGAKVDTQDITDRTALMYACTGPHPDLAALLIKNGADVNGVDSDEHWTPLMFAAAEGHLDVVQLLLAKGADNTMVDIDGESAALFAQQRGFPELAAFLATQ